MQDNFYRLLIYLSRKLGIWFFITTAWIIASGYFFFSPHKVKNSIVFYKALFPSRTILYHLCCTWKQYHNFIYVFLDRWLLQNKYVIHYTQEGWEYIEEVARMKTGGLILMSHIGNWEVGAYLMNRLSNNVSGIKLLLYLGSKRNEQIERIQKEDLVQNGINIIAAVETASSPFDILEGVRFVRSGGFIAMAGDRLLSKNQRSVPVKFLGHEVFVPEAPFAFALLSRVPLLIFFANRLGKGKYHFVAYPPRYVLASDNNERQEAISKAAQEYANIVEAIAKRHPYEWFHFEPFLGRPL